MGTLYIHMSTNKQMTMCAQYSARSRERTKQENKLQIYCQERVHVSGSTLSTSTSVHCTVHKLTNGTESVA